MINQDKLMLWGAVAIMVAVGSLSVHRVSEAPKIDPEIATLAAEHRKLMNDSRPHHPGPGRVPPIHIAFLDVIPKPRLPHPGADRIPPADGGVGVPHRPMDVLVLPFAVPGEAKADLDGATIGWALQAAPQEKLHSWMTQKPAKPAGFVIERQCEDGPVDVVARLGPDAKSFTDLSTEPRMTYRYWVSVTGQETVRTAYPAELKPVTKGLAWSAEVRTPAATRAKLVGGDRSNALLRAETYDKKQKKWVGKTAMAVPGQQIGTLGWTLKSLRFDNFTLVADVTDDEGVDRVLTTKD
jgi:hypothetical protein